MAQNRPPAQRRRPPERGQTVRRKKEQRRVPLLAKLLLTLILLPPLACLLINAFVIATTNGNLKTVEELSDTQADDIVVLGAGIQPDGTPSPILAERLDTAIALYERGAAAHIIVSGGQDAAQSEVSAMRNYLLDSGIPSLAITSDTHGIDTFASVKNLHDTYNAQQVILVSQRFHLYRAVFIGEQMGLDVSGCPASEEAIHDTGLLIREFFARIKDFGQCLFGELPQNTRSTVG